MKYLILALILSGCASPRCEYTIKIPAQKIVVEDEAGLSCKELLARWADKVEAKINQKRTER